MTTTKKAFQTRFITLLLACALIFTAVLTNTTMTVFAATTGGTDTKTITVKTQSNWYKPGSESITLRQNKQTITYKNVSGKAKEITGYYGYYTITVYNKTDNKTSTVYWKGGKTYKISLGRDKTYSIKVAYNASQTNLKALAAMPKTGWRNMSYTSASWYVSSTCKVSSYH
ncbi:MAG: hypothetical protein LUE24_09850 [Lachnospiraceae bacterium]|nr:hypothetical protein [Lachnospiraceae bacterium]